MDVQSVAAEKSLEDTIELLDSSNVTLPDRHAWAPRITSVFVNEQSIDQFDRRSFFEDARLHHRFVLLNVQRGEPGAAVASELFNNAGTHGNSLVSARVGLNHR